MPESAMEVITCLACGTKNRIRRDLPAGVSRCGACKALLVYAPPESLLLRVIDAAPELSLRLLRGATAITLLAFPAWVGYIASQHPSPREFASPRSSSPPVPQPRPTPQPFPEPELPTPETGEVVRYTDAPATAPLGIKSDLGNHYLVKLSTAPGNEPVQTIFIRGGSPVEVKVPLGTFHIKYACGQKWYGYEHLFGPSTGYSQAAEPFTFSVPGIEPWNAGMRKIESRILSFLTRSGLSLEVVREILHGGFEKWPRWSELESAIVKNPELVPAFNGLMAERRALQASEPTTTAGHTITLYKASPGILRLKKSPLMSSEQTADPSTAPGNSQNILTR